jgi:maltooligosyltrehalose trehalohydrolase
MLGERTSQLVSFEMQKLMAGAVLVSPYIPMLFMGEEYSEANPFQYFVSHTDPDLAEAVRKGRKEEFADFHSQGEAPDPMAEETFFRSKLQWNSIDKEPHKTMLAYYKQLIELRKNHTVLKHLSRQQLRMQFNKEQNTLLLNRWHEEQQVICLMNFSKKEQTINVDEEYQKFKKLFDSADPKWRGPKASPDTISGSSITMQSESIILYGNSY